MSCPFDCCAGCPALSAILQTRSALRLRLLSRGKRRLPHRRPPSLQERKTAKKRRGVENITGESVAEKWNRRCVAGQESLARLRIHRTPGPNVEVGHNKKQHRACYCRAGNTQRGPPPAQPKTDAHD